LACVGDENAESNLWLLLLLPKVWRNKDYD
jgi:hypothetical protein